MSWGPFQHRYSTQKHMPRMVYTQLKNVAKKTILRVLDKHAESENADKVFYGMPTPAQSASLFV